MEDNEIIEVVEEETIDDVVVREDNGLGTGIAIAIGAGLACAVGVGIKLGKKAIAWFKSKKELRQPDHEIEVTEEDLEEVVTK